MEIMVVIAIIVIVMGVAIPSMALLLDLQQKRAVDRLAETYAYLRDEATLRNITFRIAYYLDRGTWEVQAGSPDAVIFATPEEREAWERDYADRLSRFTEREIAEGEADDILDQEGRFRGLDDVALDSTVQLPGGTTFAWVYTPQYSEPVQPQDPPPEDPEDELVVYSYIFPDGQMEFTALQIVGVSDPEDGYTLIVEPLTGRIHLEDANFVFDDLYDWLPETAPEMP